MIEDTDMVHHLMGLGNPWGFRYPLPDIPEPMTPLTKGRCERRITAPGPHTLLFGGARH